MTEPIITHMRQYAKHLIEQCYQGKLLEWNGEPDHIHILFELPATAAPSVVVCSLKTQLSKEVRAKFWDEIKDKLWKDSFWSDSYFITTTGGANIETLERYIQDQGIEKPKRKYIKRQAKKMWKYHCTWYWFIFYAAFIPARLCRTRFSAKNWIKIPPLAMFSVIDPPSPDSRMLTCISTYFLSFKDVFTYIDKNFFIILQKFERISMSITFFIIPCLTCL